jgi:hypothetical protein
MCIRIGSLHGGNPFCLIAGHMQSAQKKIMDIAGHRHRMADFSHFPPFNVRHASESWHLSSSGSN